MKTFKAGGVHPPENKFSADAAIEILPIPKRAYVLTSQHLGIPATILVKRGDDVKTGQLIAKSSGFISANIHTLLIVFNIPLITMKHQQKSNGEICHQLLTIPYVLSIC